MSRDHDLQPAWVLHRRAYNDNSLLIELFTFRHGRVGCIARGAKSGKSRKAALLQPFTPLLVNFSGRGELKTLTTCESSGLPVNLLGQHLYAGFYLNELLMQFLPRFEALENIFAWYGELLVQLADQAFAFEAALRFFERRLLDELGLGLQLTHTAADYQPIHSDMTYIYYPDSGPDRYVEDCNMPAQFPVISGASLLALHHSSIDNAMQLKECKQLMRFVINRHLDGYRFRSRELFGKSKKNTGA